MKYCIGLLKFILYYICICYDYWYGYINNTERHINNPSILFIFIGNPFTIKYSTFSHCLICFRNSLLPCPRFSGVDDGKKCKQGESSVGRNNATRFLLLGQWLLDINRKQPKNKLLQKVQEGNSNQRQRSRGGYLICFKPFFLQIPKKYIYIYCITKLNSGICN